MDFKPTNCQERALESINKWLDNPFGKYHVLTGPAGTGKTKLATIAGKKMRGAVMCAPTNQACKVAKKLGITSEVMTLASLYSIRPKRMPNGEVVWVESRKKGERDKSQDYSKHIYDEISMIDPDLMEKIDTRSKPTHKILLIGDHCQLHPVGHDHSPAFSDAYHNGNISTLEEVVRQQDESRILENATRLRKDYSVRFEFDFGDDLQKIGDDALDYAVETYRSERDFYKFKILCHTKIAVARWSSRIRQALGYHEHMVPGDLLVADRPIFDMTGNEITHNTGEHFMVKRKSNDFGLIGPKERDGENLKTRLHYSVISAVDENGGPVTFRVPNEKGYAKMKKHREFLVKRATELRRGYAWEDVETFDNSFAGVKYGYALTTHKAQGSTYETTILDHKDMSNFGLDDTRNRVIYTALTRASKKCYIY